MTEKYLSRTIKKKVFHYIKRRIIRKNYTPLNLLPHIAMGFWEDNPQKTNINGIFLFNLAINNSVLFLTDTFLRKLSWQ